VNKVVKFLATGFGVSNFAPHPGEGTVGTLVGVLIFVVWPDSRLHPVAYWLFLVFGIAAGIYISAAAEKSFAQKDCPRIVIDEIMGFIVAMTFLPKSFWVIVAAFVIFRIFDGIKIKPISALERLPGGVGIMADDVLAGIFANVIMHIVLLFF